MFSKVAAQFDEQTDHTSYDTSAINERLRTHLDDGAHFDLWGDLRASVDLDTDTERQTQAAKNAVKRGTYSAVYGAKKQTVMRNICKEYANRGGTYPNTHAPAEGFLDHPMIDQLLDVRRRIRGKISYDDGGMDPFGRWLERETFKETDKDDISEERRSYDGDDYEGYGHKKGAKSLLAYIVQGMEVKTLWPIFQAAIKEAERDSNDRWRVMQYRYDEVIIWARKRREVEKWANHARSLVADYADAEGLLTQLDVEYAPDHVDLAA
jgi:hypothetical protein